MRRAKALSSSMSTMPAFAGGRRIGEIEYEDALSQGDPGFRLHGCRRTNGMRSRSLYLGHDGRSQGRRLPPSRRGAERGPNVLEWDMPKHPIYLWTLPMFHCNGWCFPWTIALRAGVNVCLRKAMLSLSSG